MWKCGADCANTARSFYLWISLASRPIGISDRMHAGGSCGTGGEPHIEAVRAIVEGSEVTLDGKELQRWLYGGCGVHRMAWIV